MLALKTTNNKHSTKDSTRHSVLTGGFERHVICVYTPDWQNVAEVRGVRDVLRKVGFSERLGYKRDIDTIAGVDRFVYED